MPEPRYPPRPSATPPETVDPRWLGRALGLTIAVAAVLGYLALCLLVYMGGSPFLHPSLAVTRHPQIAYEPVQLDAGTTGQPRLTGWWVPADEADQATPTLLLLHGANGSLDQTVGIVELLHHVPANVLAIDYRGFGQSGRLHPSEQSMLEDAGAALEWLTGTRHLASRSIVPVGTGLGGVTAAKLASAHPELPAVIVVNAEPEALPKMLGDPRARMLPVRLLTRDRFDLAAALSSMRQPRLLIEGMPAATLRPTLPGDHAAAVANLFREAPEPKRTVTLAGTAPDGPGAIDAIRRFLDEYVTPVVPSAAGRR